jgi:hypothetical protein
MNTAETESIKAKPTLCSEKKEAQKVWFGRRPEFQRQRDCWMRGLRADQIDDAKYGGKATEGLLYLENVGPRETKVGPPAFSAVRSFARASPQILGIFYAAIPGREICRWAMWRRERCWKPTVSAGRSEALGVTAETEFWRGLRSVLILCASQRLRLSFRFVGAASVYRDLVRLGVGLTRKSGCHLTRFNAEGTAKPPFSNANCKLTINSESCQPQ